MKKKLIKAGNSKALLLDTKTKARYNIKDEVEMTFFPTYIRIQGEGYGQEHRTSDEK